MSYFGIAYRICCTYTLQIIERGLLERCSCSFSCHGTTRQPTCGERVVCSTFEMSKTHHSNFVGKSYKGVNQRNGASTKLTSTMKERKREEISTEKIYCTQKPTLHYSTNRAICETGTSGVLYRRFQDERKFRVVTKILGWILSGGMLISHRGSLVHAHPVE